MLLRRHSKQERGSATVEAIIAFTGFLFTFFTILNVVNVCRAQMLVSNAVDAAAKSLSQYTYFYHISGLEQLDEVVSGAGNRGSERVNEVVDTVNELYKGIVTTYEDSEQRVTNILNAVEEGDADIEGITQSIKDLQSSVDQNLTDTQAAYNQMSDAIGDVTANPILYMKSILAIGLEQGMDLAKTCLVSAFAKSTVTSHFGSSKAKADQVLRGLGIDGIDSMNFMMSSLFPSDEDGKSTDLIHIVVYYEVELQQFFGGEPLKVTLCKEAKARAWLGGDAG